MEISSSIAHDQELMNAGVSPTKMEPMQQSTGEIQTQATVEVERKPRPHPDKAIDCPRCCSTDTKFCYYNNYSMSQPRYFCKACRRYWTQGGSLRNVPIGGGCRKNRRSSTSTSSSAPASLPSAAALQINKLTSEPMAPPSFSDFPNVLPTFTSTGFELPSLAFDSSSSNPAATLPLGGTFLDMLRGGLLDGNHQSNDFYGPTGGNVMVMPPSAFGVGAGLIMQQHGLGGTVDHTIGGAAAAQEEGGRGVKAMTGLQRPSPLGGGVGSACGQLQQGTVHNNNVMMDNNNNNNGSSRDCYWNNSFAGVGTASNTNPWQDLINSRSSSLI